MSPISIEVRPNRPKPNEGESHGEHHFQGQKSFLPKEVSELFFSLFVYFILFFRGLQREIKLFGRLRPTSTKSPLVRVALREGDSTALEARQTRRFRRRRKSTSSPFQKEGQGQMKAVFEHIEMNV